ncbi:hypothetical protein [Flavobacterium sp.]|uniref:hypothetical protein n=1 Tax=Flavobacterium sp. TaxID=239 RepID=UPI003D6C2042
MLKQELIKKVKAYLEKEKISSVDNSVEYLALKENVLQKDGSKKKMHVIGFLADFNKDSVDGIKGCSVYIDAETNKLSFIVTPHYMSDIED